VIGRLASALDRWRERRFRRRMHAARVLLPREGFSVRSLNPNPRAVVRQFGPRPR